MSQRAQFRGTHDVCYYAPKVHNLTTGLFFPTDWSGVNY